MLHFIFLCSFSGWLNILSSMASKPKNVRWIRTGSLSYCKIMYCRQFSANIKIEFIKLIPVLLDLAICQQAKRVSTTQLVIQVVVSITNLYLYIYYSTINQIEVWPGGIFPQKQSPIGLGVTKVTDGQRAINLLCIVDNIFCFGKFLYIIKYIVK